jgi:hypothetical protein
LAEHALVLAARLQDLGEGGAISLGVLCAYTPWQVRLLGRDDASSAKDPPSLLELRRVRELLLIVLADKDLDPIPVAPLVERGGRLASDMLALEEELC